MNISFTLNGTPVQKELSPEKPLLRVLKEDFNIKSVKEGCGRGECGTCTVLFDGRAVTSCMIATGQVINKEVHTLEGLEKEGKIKYIQKAFVESGAVQCGFCTPGFIIAAYAFLKNRNYKDIPSREDIRVAISGNICRCTGYTKIIDGIVLAAKYLKKDS